MAPLAWVRRIAAGFPELHTIPLFGNAPPLDWELLSSAIASRFGLAHLAIRPREQVWRETTEIKKNLLLIVPIAISPLGTALWIASREDVVKLTSWLMKPGNKARALSSEILQEGFYRYLILEALDAVQEMEPFQELTLQISEEETPFEKAFCIDMEFDLGNKSCWGRLAIPAELRTAWIQHFSLRPLEYTPTEIAREIPLALSVKTGSILLSQEEWERIEMGDFVSFDQGSYDAHKGTGVATLMLQSIPIFNIKIKQNKIELIDYAFYYEENMEKPKGEKPKGEEGEIAALKELPLHVVVEIAQLKMTLDQLMHLTPGNFLELPIHPDQGVFLTVNGQKVGRAELVYLGEQLGVRILEIG